MRFSKTTDYALRIMVALALARDERLSLHSLAQREKIPRKFLEHVVRSLKSADLIYSTPGPKGGFQLVQPPQMISLAQILLAVQGPLLPVDRMATTSLPDHLQEPIQRLRVVLSDIRAYARHQLESITLADMAQVSQIDEAHETLMYYI